MNIKPKISIIWPMLFTKTINKQKTTYALKTPRAVALQFIYGVECIIMRKKLQRNRGRKCREATSSVLTASVTTVILPPMHATRGRFWVWWPWPFTYELDLRTWPRYFQPWPTCQNASLYVCSFGQDSETDGHTDRQTHDAKTVTPSAVAGCNNLKKKSY